MKGLLIKDFKLVKNMGHTLAIILLVAVGMSFYSSDTSFIVVYMAIIGTTFTSSTISYDEFENGNAFLFSLPVSRKDYVLEKYLFSLLMSGGGWLLGSVLSIAAGVVRDRFDPIEGMVTAQMLLPIAICLNMILVPVRLKYEGEKSRIALMIVMGGIFLVTVLGAKIAGRLGIDLSVLGEKMPVMSQGAGIGIAIAVSIALLLLSYHISVHIMERKEF